MASAKESSARTPSRTIRLSSARKTDIRPSGMGSIWPDPPTDSKGASILGWWKPPSLADHRPTSSTPPSGDGYLGLQVRFVRGQEMRFESSVTSITWIPSEAIKGMTKMPFEIGVAHYDPPPPDSIEDLEALRQADRFRFANELRAWFEVEDGRIVDSGYSGKGLIGSTTVSLGLGKATIAAISLPDRQLKPE